MRWGQPRDYEHVTQGTSSGEKVWRRDGVTPRAGSGSMVTVETGNLTPGVVSVREGYTGDCGYVIPGAQTILVGSP